MDADTFWFLQRERLAAQEAKQARVKPRFPEPCQVRLGPDRHVPAAWECRGCWYLTAAVLGFWKEAGVCYELPGVPIAEWSVFRLQSTCGAIMTLAYSHREKTWAVRHVED